jgi:hypothetical protein
LESNKNDCLEAVKDFVICDEEEVLLGQEKKLLKATPYLHYMLLHFETNLTKRLRKKFYGFTSVVLPKVDSLVNTCFEGI